MLSAWVFEKVAYIVISIAAGLTFFYVTSPLEKSVKKQQMEENSSLIINFILFIWAGKILLNIGIFVTDPLAVLAYPSNSNAFYLAVLLLIINIAYRSRKKYLNVSTATSSLVPIFLGSAFVYEFIEVILNANTLSRGHLGLLLIILVIFLIMYERRSPAMVAGCVFAAWSLGQLMLTTLMSYTTLYGYILAEWFLIIVLIISITVLIFHQRKRVKS